MVEVVLRFKFGSFYVILIEISTKTILNSFSNANNKIRQCSCVAV